MMGYQATVYEAPDVAGGMMFHGILEFRLARAVIDKEIGKILRLGAELRLNAPLTDTFGISRFMRSAQGQEECEEARKEGARPFPPSARG